MKSKFSPPAPSNLLPQVLCSEETPAWWQMLKHFAAARANANKQGGTFKALPMSFA